VATFGNGGAVKLEPMLKAINLRSATTQTPSDSSFLYTATIYIAAFTTGAIVMSFEMLGSRYLILFSVTASIRGRRSSLPSWPHLPHFLGGFIADRTVSAAVLGVIIVGASLYLLALPSFAESILSFVFDKVDNVRLGSLYSALAIMFLPATLFGVYSPFAIRLVLRTAHRSGTVSGAVYGVSTAGSIVGTLGTTFFLIPAIGTRAITLLLGLAGMSCGLCLIALHRLLALRAVAKTAAGLVVLASFVLTGDDAASADLFSANVRAQMLNHEDGRIAHLETEYNNVYINKYGPFLSMTTRVRNEINYHSVIDRVPRAARTG